MDIKEISRKLRRAPTPAEAMLWSHLRLRQIKGKRFLRQFPIVFRADGERRMFIPDFYCAEVKLIVEVDGSVHDQQKDYDAFRTDILADMGFTVLRFKNEDILHDIENVLKKIEDYLPSSLV